MQHDGGPAAYVPATTVATWPKGSFAENLAIDSAGRILVTLHTDRAVARVDPDTGAAETFATLPAPVAGLALNRDGDLFVSGGTPGQAPGWLWRISGETVISQVAEISDAVFLNGMAWHPDGRLLVVESVGGRIYAVDPRSGHVTVWLSDDALVPDHSGTPGANGIKLFEGHAYISVTAHDRIVRVPILPDGAPGRVETIAERLRADDFAMGADGALYIATHPARSLVRLAPDGTRTTLAAAEQGMTGATAAAFGRRPADRSSLYVTTTGGTMTLPQAQWEVAKLVRLDVGADGAPAI